MTKVMNLDMFCFEYKPIFSENEKVSYCNGHIIASLDGNVKIIQNSDVICVKYDTLFEERMKKIREKPWTTEEILNSLKLINSENQTEQVKYRLLYTKPEDERDVSFEFMTDTLLNLNYEEISFEYIAYGE